MVLSDLSARQAKATGKAYTLADSEGLALAVPDTGGKTWHFRYYWLGKQKRISLGAYPEVTLREARDLRNEAHSLLAKGINPRVHRKQRRSAAKLAGENTFEPSTSNGLPTAHSVSRRAGSARPRHSRASSTRTFCLSWASVRSTRSSAQICWK